MPLSVLIRAITGEDCSHFSFVFESAAKGLMFESNLFGTHPTFYATALKTHVVMHSIEVPLSITEEDAIWDLVIQKYDGRSYNFLGALYLGGWKLLQRIFGVRPPVYNKWSLPDTYFCNELYSILNAIPEFPQTGVASGMETPHDLWLKIKDWSPK
jgi:hypothetical protein